MYRKVMRLAGRVLVPVLVIASSVPALASGQPEGTLGPAPLPEAVEWKGPLMGPGTNKQQHFFTLKVDVPVGYWAEKVGGLEVVISWGEGGATGAATDFNLSVYNGHHHRVPGLQRFIAESNQVGTSEERVFIPDPSGDYTVRVHHFAGAPDDYQGLATFRLLGERGGPVFDRDRALGFGPASIVSAHFLGPEPMVTMERQLPGSDGVDPDRIFVDWPLSPMKKIGQLSRSTDGGDSFRLLFDPDCAQFSRPTCSAAGGSDTHAEVNLIDGTVYFSAQELVTAESFSSSTDHGDTFPEERQQQVTNTVTGTDRQWIAPAGGGVATLAGPVKAFFAYHIPGVAQYIHGVRSDGKVLPQPDPQLSNVIQSGPLRVAHTGRGGAWIYQPYQAFGAEAGTELRVATAKAPEYALPNAWQSTVVTTQTPRIFPWLDVDPEGTAYMVWVNDNDNHLYYSASPIRDPRNDPTLTVPGRPGTFWTDPARISLPELGNTIFPQVVAGPDGRFGVTYVGTDDWTGFPADAPATTEWHSYAAIVSDALGKKGSPVVTSGTVSHRPVHRGEICQDGPFCGDTTDDHSLADMIDLGFDQEGRLGVVFSDNNSGFATLKRPEDPKGRPFGHFAKQVSGPSLLSDAALPSTPDRESGSDPAGDATWPNTSGGRLLPSLDVLDARVSLEGEDLVARVELGSADEVVMKSDLTSYNTPGSSNPPADRLQYVVRYATENDIYHLSMESLSDGTRRFFGGVLGPNDRLLDDRTPRGAGYHTDLEKPVSGVVDGNTLVLRARAAEYGVQEGTQLYSVTAFGMAGPMESQETTIFETMRTVDASPPFDVVPTQPSPSEPPPPTTETPMPAPTASQPSVHRLDLSPAESKGRLRREMRLVATASDAEGHPVAGTPIEWSTAGAGEVLIADSTTDAEGRAEAVVISDQPGKQTITAVAVSCAEPGACSVSAVRNWGPARCELFGSVDDDLLRGSSAAEVICGFGGNDVIFGKGGNDDLLGHSGNDRLYGRDGADRIFGHRGDDELRGGGGSDLLVGGSGADLSFGGAGRDRCRGIRGDRYQSCRL